MKIGEIADRLGVTTRTLRFYEEQGLIRPHRSARGTRRYTHEDEQRFAAILALTRVGIPLEHIRQLAAVRPHSHTGDEAGHKVYTLLETLRADINERRAHLERTEQDLCHAERLVQSCFGCKQPPTRKGCNGCHVARDLAHTQVANLIWDQEPGLRIQNL